MQITIQVDPAMAKALQSTKKRGKADAAIQIRDLLQKVNASIEAMHPGTQDGELSHYFTVNVSDADALALQDALLQAKGVTAAYIQPSEELP